MSNVLIGIIGVILFIGLALAGALILGDDFKSATTSSKASTIIAQMQQVSTALNMYQVKTGSPMSSAAGTSSIIAALQPRFLKTPPIVPAGASFYLTDSNIAASSLPVSVILVLIGNDANALAICSAVETSLRDGSTPNMTPQANFQGYIAGRPGTGCFAYTNGSAPYYYYAYQTT